MEKPGAGAKGRDSETGTAENSHFDPFFFTFSLAMRKKKKNNREIAVYLSDKLKAVHPLLEFLLLSEMFHEVFCEIYIKM